MNSPTPDDPEIAAQAFDLMRALVTLTGEKWVTASRFETLADQWVPGDVQARIAFLAGVRNLLRDIPLKVFADPEIRQSILTAAQDALDAAIDREEEGQEERES